MKEAPHWVPVQDGRLYFGDTYAAHPEAISVEFDRVVTVSQTPLVNTTDHIPLASQRQYDQLRFALATLRVSALLGGDNTVFVHSFNSPDRSADVAIAAHAIDTGQSFEDAIDEITESTWSPPDWWAPRQFALDYLNIEEDARVSSAATTR